MDAVINWMGGWPKEGLISESAWASRLAEAASNRSNHAEGIDCDSRLRGQLAAGLLHNRTGTDGDRLLLTNGADDALLQLIRQYVLPGDAIIVERITARSVLQSFGKAGAKLVPVAGDAAGMDPEALAAALREQRPRMVYVSMSCADPTGNSWELERCRLIGQVCREAGVLLVADERQEQLYYDVVAPNSNLSQEPGMLVIGQLPPGVIAGLRIGWITGDQTLLKKLAVPDQKSEARPKQSLAESSGKLELERSALSAFIAEQPLEPIVEMLRIQCRERMHILTAQLAGCQIADLSWTVPLGGLHLWVTLPEGLEGEALLRCAWMKGLIFQPGAPFYAAQPRTNKIRLTFAFASDRQIKAGVARLAESISEFTGRWSHA